VEVNKENEMKRTIITTLLFATMCQTAIAVLSPVTLVGPKVELLRPSLLRINPGYESCVASTQNNPGGFFNLSIRELDGVWYLAVQNGPHISGCGTPLGGLVSGDMTYFFKSTNGPLGTYRPVYYDGAGVITCAEMKNSNTSLFSPNSSIDSCNLTEGFFGTGNILITSHDSNSFLLTEEKGLLDTTGITEAFWTYYNILDTDGEFRTGFDRRLIMSTSDLGQSHVKPVTFRFHSSDQFIPFFVNFYSQPGFTNGGTAFGVIDFLSYPDSHNSWLQTSSTTMTKLTSGRQAPILYSVDQGPGNPPNGSKLIGTVLGPMNGNDGFPGYVAFYPRARNGNGGPCPGGVGGKENVLMYSGFAINTVTTPRGQLPIFGGWTGEHTVVKTTLGTEYVASGQDSISNVYVHPTSQYSGYIFWTEGVTCTELQHSDRTLYGQQYSLIYK
jgi:hypothetical protein